MKRSVHWSGRLLQHSSNAIGSGISATILPVSTYSTLTSRLRPAKPLTLTTTNTPMRAASSAVTFMCSVNFTPPPSIKQYFT